MHPGCCRYRYPPKFLEVGLSLVLGARAGGQGRRVRSGGGFLGVGPTVSIRIGVGIEGFSEQLVFIVLFFPDVAQAVVVGIDNGVEGEDRQQDGGKEQDSGSHLEPPSLPCSAGASVRQ